MDHHVKVCRAGPQGNDGHRVSRLIDSEDERPESHIQTHVLKADCPETKMACKRALREIAVVLPAQASDAVENFLTELGALGVSIEQFDLTSSTETVRGYFPGDRPTEGLRASVEVYLKAIQAYFPPPMEWRVSLRMLGHQNWEERWKAFLRPIRVTRRIVIKPTWEPYQARKEEILVTIDPGMAFGTGLHATTRLCLEILDREFGQRTEATLMKGSLGPSVLDVGTGSGILAIAAAKMGARRVVGIDIDETAIAVARQNVRRNGVERVVRISRQNLRGLRGRFDLVVANIDPSTLVELKGPLMCHVSQEGRLVLSGILTEQKVALSEIFRDGGFPLVDEKSREGWSCLVLERP
jgi:ribosomal protein L11 methyltransferase